MYSASNTFGNYMLDKIPGIAIQDIRPLVILGAGASHDLINPRYDYNYAFKDSESRPPLMDGIFGHNPFFQNIQKEFPKLSGFIGMIRDRCLKKGLEDVLDDINKDPHEAVIYKNEIDEFKRYITHLFLAISDENKKYPINNYDSFFRRMKSVCKYYFVVNFNYDLLAQLSIAKLLDIQFSDFQSYINHEIKLIHVHGSVLWGPDGRFGSVKQKGANIVIPSATGKKFVCPEDHLDMLSSYISNEANVVIIVGWKGREDHFRDELLKNICEPKRIVLIGGSDKPDLSVLANCGLSRFRDVQRIYVQHFSNFLERYPDFRSDIKVDNLIIDDYF